MDNRDQIIKTQLEVIGDLINNNLRRVTDDFWGAPKKDAPAALPERDASVCRDERPKAPVKANEGPAAPARKAAPEQSAAEEIPPKENIEDIRKELNELIGLSGIKKEVSSLISIATVYGMRKKHGLKNVEMSLHMVFSGNPGTGKTTIARIMARVYHSLDILSKGHLVEVDRAGLVAGYVGQTAGKTMDVISHAKGGVLFIDEAYALTNKTENDFGQEAVDTLLKAMEDQREDLVVIVAGYDGLMDDFVHSNPGLESRFNRFLHFDDYTVDEMLDILALQLRKGQYTLGEAAREEVRAYIQEANTSSIAFGNARGVRNIFERVLVEQANRLTAIGDVTTEQLMEILPEDVRAARDQDPKLTARREAEAALRQAADEARAALAEMERADALPPEPDADGEESDMDSEEPDADSEEPNADSEEPEMEE